MLSSMDLKRTDPLDENMPGKKKQPQIPLPKSWDTYVKSKAKGNPKQKDMHFLANGTREVLAETVITVLPEMTCHGRATTGHRVYARLCMSFPFTE